ncbi:MAG: Zn-dependent hydrolase, glyoxylase [Herbinix sp.]|jgi:glyoxylase-like metal-dependent hydrolase (beta-lactamase superfamily II)|nr:Zn-dependent hydrolase, glyoxylase [Herbinix sp.]
MNIINLSYKSTNCYLIAVDNGWLMVDAGWPDTFSQLLQLLNQNDISVNEINYLIVTHFHPDHAGLTQNLKDLGTNLVLHEVQVPYINKLNLMYKKNPKANFKDIMTNNNIVLTDADNRSFLKSIGINGELITTPGHSDDSVSLIIDDCCAFTGDLPALSLAEAYDDFVIDDSWDMIQRHPVKKIYPGHGEPYEI